MKSPRRPLRVSANTPYRQWPEFLTFREAGELLGVDVRTIRRMTAAGELPVEPHGRLKHIHKSRLKPKEVK